MAKIKVFKKIKKSKYNTIDFKNRCLIFVDLDGTMLDDYSHINDFSRKVIKALQNKGHIVCICTGRPKRSSIRYYYELGLNTPIVNYNGACINRPNDPHFLPIHFYISLETIVELFSNKKLIEMINNVILENDEGTHILFNTSASKQQMTKALEKFNIYTSENVQILKGDFDQLKHGAFSILIEPKSEIKIRDITNEVKKVCPTVVVRGWTEPHAGTILEINSLFSSKGLALRYLSSYYNIPLSRCYAFGDNENDTYMLKAAGHGYAMINGTKEAKDSANCITDFSNQEQGVARKLNDIFHLGIKFE